MLIHPFFTRGATKYKLQSVVRLAIIRSVFKDLRQSRWTGRAAAAAGANKSVATQAVLERAEERTHEADANFNTTSNLALSGAKFIYIFSNCSSKVPPLTTPTIIQPRD